jgi:hypothetical protein
MRADDRAIDDKIRMPLFVVFGRPMVCALSALGLGRSVVIYVNNACDKKGKCDYLVTTQKWITPGFCQLYIHVIISRFIGKQSTCRNAWPTLSSNKIVQESSS